MPAPYFARRRGGGIPDYNAGLDGMLRNVQEKTGHRVTEEQKIIPDGMTFRQWCEKLGREGLKVDGKPFTLEDRPAMAWIYDQVPSTLDEAYSYVLVLMKCAQVGFTVMEMLACIYLGLRFGPGTVGMFLPDINLAGIKSTERFMPIVRSVPQVHAKMNQDAADGTGRKSGEGAVTRRRIGEALFIFSWTSGRATTESVPMDVVSYDEVQEMTLAQIEKTQERLSASRVRFTLMGSTANWPDSDIHFWFKKGSQYRFHSECPTCGAKKPLDDYFPDCIRYDEARNVYRYVCEKGHWLEDPQHGEWIPDNLGAGEPDFDRTLPRRDWPLRIRSIHFPQFLSPTISAGNIIQAYREATDQKNFHNRKLGKPYLDPTQVPVTLEHMARCVEAGKAAGIKWKRGSRGAFMGIDQMGGYNVVVIKERLADGRQAVVHLEEIYSEDPFARCDELMEAFNVQACVGEINPNYNDMKRFANRHQGRVFICDSFGSLVEDMVKWGDAPKLDVSERRTEEDERDRYTVRIDQFKCMQTSMARFTAKNPLCLFPDPDELVQEVVEKGIRKPEPVARRAFLHFTKTALVVEKDEEGGTNKYKRVVRKIAIDPHYSYANLLCDVAYARAHGTAMFMLPDMLASTQVEGAMTTAINREQLPAHVQSMMSDLPESVCGRCSAFTRGDDGETPDVSPCSERAGLKVGKADPCCPLFVALDF